ncbi:MAG: LptF/LptG family permease [Planctomycetes bacterium]|nr:LptF/LptG family permease [Planctomycetota bacterium]
MILFRYILREIAVAFVLMFVPVTFVSLVAMIFQVMKLAPSTGLGLVVEAVPIVLAYMGPWVLALATCAGTTLAYGRMSAENELDAIITSGVHPRALFTPAIAFGLLLCGAAYLLSAYGSPTARYHRRVLLRKVWLHVLQAPPQGNQTFKLWGKYTLSYVNSENGVLERPLVVENLSEGGYRESFAKSGRFVLRGNEPPMIILVNGEMWETTPTSRRRISGEGDIRVSFDIDNLYERANVASELSSRELLARAARDPGNRAEMMSEYHARFARGATPLFLISIGAAIGIFVRRGSRLAGLGASVPPFLLYVLLELVFVSLGNHGRIPPPAAAWAPNAIVGAAAAPLLWKILRR